MVSMKGGVVNKEIKDKEQIIRELKVARAHLAIEIERKTTQVQNADKLIANLKTELNITAQKLKDEVLKRKELNSLLEACITKYKKLSRSIEDLSSDNNIFKKIRNELNEIGWFRELHFLKPEYES